MFGPNITTFFGNLGGMMPFNKKSSLDVNNKFTHDFFGVGGINGMAILVITVAIVGGMG
jgi:hypothetical protein